MKAYILSLPFSRNRANKLIASLSNVEYEIVDGVIAAEVLSSKELAEVKYRSKFNTTTRREITNGEIGCVLGHFRILETFLASDDEYCLALEDDCWYSLGDEPVLSQKLDGFAKYLLSDNAIAIIKMNTARQTRWTYGLMPEVFDVGKGTVQFAKQSFYDTCTQAIMWNRSTAQLLFDMYKDSYDVAYDTLLCQFAEHITLYQTVCKSRFFNYEKFSTSISDIHKIDKASGSNTRRSDMQFNTEFIEKFELRHAELANTDISKQEAFDLF